MPLRGRSAAPSGLSRFASQAKPAAAIAFALALASCDLVPSTEANPIRYRIVASIADSSDPLAGKAQAALADGKLTNAEYHDLIAAWDAERDAEYRRDKAAAIAKWGRK